jgi:hypothetical protein
MKEGSMRKGSMRKGSMRKGSMRKGSMRKVPGQAIGAAVGANVVSRRMGRDGVGILGQHTFWPAPGQAAAFAAFASIQA